MNVLMKTAMEGTGSSCGEGVKAGKTTAVIVYVEDGGGGGSCNGVMMVLVSMMTYAEKMTLECKSLLRL